MAKKTGDSGDAEGNTKSPRINQCKRWCFTLNNWSIEELNSITQLFEKKGIHYLIGKEIGEMETPHLQAYIECPKRMRWSEFGLTNRIHWEKCRGNRDDNVNYCIKDGNYITNYFTPLKIITNLKPWQLAFEKQMLTEPDGRTIHWAYDCKGGIGKSSFCKYMAVKHKALVIQGGKLSDIVNIIFNTDMLACRILIIDIPRINENNVSYAAIECILNGMITNTKFETGIKLFNPPHVLCFSNFEPDMSCLSEDRWKIYKL